MTDATQIFSRRFEVRCKDDRLVAVYMDLYRLPEGHSKSFPEGFRFSWIAYDPEDPPAKVLFDCHFPKGPHIHVDGDPVGEPFEWTMVDAAYALFFMKVRERFGEFTMDEE